LVNSNDSRLSDSRTPSGSAGGDLTGTYPSPTLKNVGTAGSYGSASAVPVITTDSAGRVSGVTATNIQITESQVTNLTTDLGSKVSSVSAADGTITIAGTSTAPTVAVGSIAQSQVTGLTTALNAKAPTASPTFTGTLTAPVIVDSGLSVAGYVTNTSGGQLGTVPTIPNAGLTNSSITINGSAISLGGSATVLVPNYRVFPTGYYSVKATTSNSSPSATVLVAQPFWLSTTTTFTKIGVYVSSSGASSTFRLGIWNNDANDKPSTLFADYGTVATTSTGFKEITGQTITLSAGLWWLGGVNATGSPVASLGATSNGYPLYPVPPTAVTSNTAYNGYTGTYSSGTLPAFNTFTLALQTPIIYLGL
jgi:hypothetical protein